MLAGSSRVAIRQKMHIRSLTFIAHSPLAIFVLYRKELAKAEDPEAEKKRLETEYRERYLTPYAAAHAGYIDDVIEPAETRMMVIKALKAIQNKVEQRPPRKHGNMPV